MPDNTTIDLRGLKCPGPIVQLNEEIANIEAGSEVVAMADDRAFELDVQAWCRRTGHELVSFEILDETLTACIRKQSN